MPRSPPAQSPGGMLKRTLRRRAARSRAATSSGGWSYGKRNSTASKPASAAAVKRWRNGTSLNIIVRLAANLGICDSRRSEVQLERGREIMDLLPGEHARRVPAQEQEELGGLLQLLDRVHGGVERAPRHHRAVVREQHGGVTAGEPAHDVGEARSRHSTIAYAVDGPKHKKQVGPWRL